MCKILIGCVMEIIGLMMNKPQTLGAGLKRVKKHFGVTGENLSNQLGERQYNCYGGNHVLDISTHGTPRNAVLTLEVDKNKNVEKSLLGKISDITKTFSRKFIYKDGIIGQYHEKRIAVEKFVPEDSGFLCDRKLTNVKRKTRTIEPWLFERIEY